MHVLTAVQAISPQNDARLRGNKTGCRNHPNSSLVPHIYLSQKTISLIPAHECTSSTQQEQHLGMSHTFRNAQYYGFPPSIYSSFTILPDQMHITNQELRLPLSSLPLVILPLDFKEKVLEEDQPKAIFIGGSRKSFVNPILTYTKVQHYKISECWG